MALVPTWQVMPDQGGAVLRSVAAVVFDPGRGHRCRFQIPLEACPDGGLLTFADSADDRGEELQRAFRLDVPRPAHPCSADVWFERQGPADLGGGHARGVREPRWTLVVRGLQD